MISYFITIYGTRPLIATIRERHGKDPAGLYTVHNRFVHVKKNEKYKNAISVIKNAVYPHDAERKWIQAHPVVLYEAYILQHIISCLSENHVTRSFITVSLP